MVKSEVKSVWSIKLIINNNLYSDLNINYIIKI